MSLSAPSSAIGIAGAAAEIEDVAALREIARELLDLRLERERLRHQPRHLDQGVHQRAARPSRTARRARGRPPTARHASTASWQVKALVEATPISGPASVGITTSLSRAMVEVGTLTIGQRVLLVLLGIAQRRQRVGGLARLRDEDARARPARSGASR